MSTSLNRPTFYTVNAALPRAKWRTKNEIIKRPAFHLLRLCLSLQTRGFQCSHPIKERIPKGIWRLILAFSLRLRPCLAGEGLLSSWTAQGSHLLIWGMCFKWKVWPASGNVRSVFPMPKLMPASNVRVVLCCGDPCPFRPAHGSR